MCLLDFLAKSVCQFIRHAGEDGGFGNRLGIGAEAPWILQLFLWGTLLQVFIAWVNKLAMWWHYCLEDKDFPWTTRRGRFVKWYTGARFWPEGALDAASVALFLCATWRVIDLMTRGGQ